MTRVSVLGGWRKGRANTERGSGLYLKRFITNNHVQAIVIHEGDGLMEYEGYEYLGPLDITGPIKTTENTQELPPGHYIYRGAYDSDNMLVFLSKETKLKEGDSYIGPIFTYCPTAEDIVVPKTYFYSKCYTHGSKLHTYRLNSRDGIVFEISSPVEETAKELFKQGVEKLFPKGEAE